MSELFPQIDPNGLLEYSVVFTDRSLNHMSKQFQQIMQDISARLKSVYDADAVALVPGGGTFGMEAIARQFASGKKALVLRNGWFSYRWSQIFDMGSIPSSHAVLKARPLSLEKQAPFAPAPLAEVLETIAKEKPDILFAAHVETASGLILPESYIKAVATAMHAHGGLVVLDCIASGAVFPSMKSLGVDVLLSAPQKGWSASPGCALVMLGADAHRRIEGSRSSSFSCDLLKWLQIMKTYESGSHAYHATMPTDALARFHVAMKEMEAYGLEKLTKAQWELGQRVRELLSRRGFRSVAAPGFEAPGVVVCFTDDEGIHKGTSFAKLGLQTAAGVPLACDEGESYKSFRLGLFGLDKLQNIDRTLSYLEKALDQLPSP